MSVNLTECTAQCKRQFSEQADSVTQSFIHRIEIGSYIKEIIRFCWIHPTNSQMPHLYAPEFSPRLSFPFSASEFRLMLLQICLSVVCNVVTFYPKS